MGLLAPKDQEFVGGLTKLRFDQEVKEVEVRINDKLFHLEEGDDGPASTFTIDLNGFSPGIKLNFLIIYVDSAGTRDSARFSVSKPRHDQGGMGATVIRKGDDINGVFFKFWLPNVANVYVRGKFNKWKDLNRLDQLGNSGYWYGFSDEARPGDNYRFFVYTFDGKAREVSDPAARQTIKTKYNAADAQDANAVIVDPVAFQWLHKNDFISERRDFRKHIIYQLHPGTFRRTGTGLPYERFVPAVPTATDAKKRKSIREKLQYVVDLGFTAIELLPIHEANGDRNAGYDPSFLFAVESTYGSPDDLRLMVDEAHGIGLAVIFDSVINHLTADLARSSFSQEFLRGWYVKRDAPWSNHKQWGGSDWGDDPDFERPEIRNLLTDCMIMYAEEFNVDGIRFDATTTIPRFALEEMIGNLRSNPHSRSIYLIAEHLTDDPFPYVIGNIGFSGGWYKPAYYAGMVGVLEPLGRGDINSLRKAVETNHNGEPTTAIKYILGSHDENWKNHGGQSPTARLGGSGNDHARMKMRLGWSLAACSLGTPMMFMGTECLEDISWDNDSGYGQMNWQASASSNGGKFKKMVFAINDLRKKHGALRGPNIDCKLVHWDHDNGVVAYKRWDIAGGVFLIVINVSDNNWGRREYQVQCGTPNSVWHECFTSQFVDFGGWTGACNSDRAFNPRADGSGLLQGINVPKWSLLILKQQ